ncbi:MAG: hypothetical protein RR247_03155 [Clostridia bacterium]
MLDKRSENVLLLLEKECPSGFKVMELADIVCAVSKNELTAQSVLHILAHLDKSGYISVKYTDDSVVCLCVLPFGRQFVESRDRENLRQKKFKILGVKFFIAMLIVTMLGAFIGCFIAKIIFLKW